MKNYLKEKYGDTAQERHPGQEWARPMPMRAKRSALLGVHLLLVDGRADLRSKLNTTFKPFGIQIKYVSDLRSAVRETANQTYDAVISSYHLPDGTGLDLYQKLRALQPGLPFLILSGDAWITVSDPQFAFMSKPFDPASMICALSRLLLLSRRRDEPAPADGNR